MDRLKFLRLQDNLLQKEVAENIGITPQAYHYYEIGRCQPSYDILIKLAKFYNVTIDYLLGNDNTKPKEIKNEIQILYDQLNDNQKSRLIGYAKGMIAESEHFDKNSILNKKLK